MFLCVIWVYWHTHICHYFLKYKKDRCTIIRFQKFIIIRCFYQWYILIISSKIINISAKKRMLRKYKNEYNSPWLHFIAAFTKPLKIFQWICGNCIASIEMFRNPQRTSGNIYCNSNEMALLKVLSVVQINSFNNDIKVSFRFQLVMYYTELSQILPHPC